MTRRPPGSTRTDPRFPYTTLFRSPDQALPLQRADGLAGGDARDAELLRQRLQRGNLLARRPFAAGDPPLQHRSEEHTSELQSLMRISYAVFCLKKKKTIILHNYAVYHTLFK